MAKISTQSLIEKLLKARSEYLSIVAKLEDAALDPDTKTKAAFIIQETQIHTDIALEQIQD